jgi:hypothetical protein
MNPENHAERYSKYMSSTVWSTDPYDLHRPASNCEPREFDEANSSRLEAENTADQKYLLRGELFERFVVLSERFVHR